MIVCVCVQTVGVKRCAIECAQWRRQRVCCCQLADCVVPVLRAVRRAHECCALVCVSAMQGNGSGVGRHAVSLQLEGRRWSIIII